ncbi:MAG TPA: YezD family protein [Bacillota bacterium]|nr:YezD family protein [Bacillota bacterium]
MQVAEIETHKAESVLSEGDLQRLLGLLSEIAYGSVTLIIQNGKVVQIEKNEKVRLK